MTAERRERVREACVVAGLAGLALIVCAPVIGSGMRWGFWDWDIFEANLEVARASVTKFGQAPGWNPYLRGGESLVGHPLMPLGSPSFLVVLVFGTIPGIKIWIVVRQFVALLGAYLLGRRLVMGRLGALTVAVVFGLSSCYAQRVAHGHWNLQAFVYLPLLLYFGLDAIRPGRLRSRALGAVCLALTFLDGGPYTFIFGWLGLAVLLAIGTARRQGRSALAGAALIGAIAVCLTAVKLLPTLEGYGDSAAPVAYGPGVMLDFYDPEFSPSIGEFLYAAWLDRDQASRPGRFPLFHLNVGAYVGPLALALVVIGVFASRVARVALLVGLPLLWLCLGSSFPLNLWELVHRLPIADAMRAPAKFTPTYLLALAVAGGAGVDAISRRLGASRALRWVPAALVALLAIDLAAVSRPVFAHAFPVEPFAVDPGAFHQREFTPYSGKTYRRVKMSLALHPASVPPRYSLTANLPAVLANFGVIKTITGNRSEGPVAAAPDLDRRLGLTHESSAPGREPQLLDWSPNVIRIGVDPRRGGRLVINYNHHPGWSARSAERTLRVVSHGPGLLGAELEAGVQEVTFSFHSSSRRAGAVVSGLAVIATIVLVARRTRRD